MWRGLIRFSNGLTRLRLAQSLVRALIEEKILEILKTKYQWNQEKIKRYDCSHITVLVPILYVAI